MMALTTLVVLTGLAVAPTNHGGAAHPPKHRRAVAVPTKAQAQVARPRPDAIPVPYANCDHSTVPPIVNTNDIFCFFNKYAIGDTYANCDGSTAAPVLNVLDIQCFLNSYAAATGAKR